MAQVLTKTPAQMAADGYAVVIAAGERIQIWSALIGGDTVYRVFDSTGNKAMQVNNTDPSILATFAIAVVVLDLVNISTAGAGAKAAAQTTILNGLDRL